MPRTLAADAAYGSGLMLGWLMGRGVEPHIPTRNLYEAEREHVRGLKETPAFKCSARLRKKVEMRFAHLKRYLNFRRLRLRGLTGAQDEFLLAAAAQNLRKLVRFLGLAPPSGTFCAA
jgi:Transposase DDE domain